MNHHASAPRGAMTHAMRTRTVVGDERALRVAVMLGTSIIAERVFRGDARVSIGRTERASFVVDSETTPEHIELIEVRGELREIHLAPSLTGRLHDGRESRSVASLRDRRARLPIDTAWRGRLELGEIVVLFQFVRALPVGPRPQLPVAIRARPLGALDWTWNACAAAFLAMALGGAAYAEYLYDPVVSDDEPERIMRLVRLMAPEAPQARTSEAPETGPAATSEGAASASQRVRTAARPRPTAARSAPGVDAEAAAQRAGIAADRAAQAALGTLRRGTFAPLVGALEVGEGSARDRLAQGAIQEETLAALRDTHGITTGSRPGIASRVEGDPGAQRSLCGEACMAQRRVERGAPEIGSSTATRERVIRPIMVPVEQPIDGVGEVDPGAVASRIRGQLGGVRSCYERALRENPSLRGRLEVRFTLGEAGRITRIQSSGLPEAPELGACVSQRLRGLAFPPARGGSVEFMFPFVLDHQ